MDNQEIVDKDTNLEESKTKKEKTAPKVKKSPKEKKPPKVKKAPKEKSSIYDKKKSKKGIIIPFIIVIIIFLSIILIKFDVAGLGSKAIGPKIKNVPVLNLIVPKNKNQESEIKDSAYYNFETIDEAIERLKATEILLKEKEKEAEKLNEILLHNKSEIERLKVFESDQLQFKEDKAEFDLLVAQKADPESFMSFVEKMYPESALKIYESLIKEKQFNEELENISNMYQEMKPKNAAAILQQTVSTDIDMAAQILLKLEPSQAGAILAAMDSNVADKISRYMYPEKN